MKNRKTVKINLQLNRRSTTLDSPVQYKPNDSLQTTKAVERQQKFLQLTINNRRQTSQPSTRNPQNHAKISEFTSQEDPKWDIITKQIILSDRSKGHHVVSRNLAMPAEDKKPRGIASKDNKQIQLIRQEINKKQKHINFYQKLLLQKKQVFQRQIDQKVNKYEQYLQNLIRLYQMQLERGQEMTHTISERQANEMYKQRRRIINKEGKMGLNYTPKRVSLLRGIIADSPLLSQSSMNCDQKLASIQHFSFGSKSKANRLTKDYQIDQTAVYLDVTEQSGCREISFEEE